MKKIKEGKPNQRQLLFVPLPLKDESPTSIFKRAARKSGCRREALLFSHFPGINLNNSCLPRNGQIPIFLALQAGSHSEQLLSGFYKMTGLGYRRSTLIIQGLRVFTKAIRYRHCAFCSECYFEGKELYFRDIALMGACPIHLRKYITHCPSCGIHLRWFSPLYQQCACGFELTSEPIELDQAEPELFLADIWRRKDQEGLDRLITILKTLEYKASSPEISHSRIQLTAAIHIIKGNPDRLACYARHLLDCHPDIPQDLVKIKLSGLPGINDEKIDQIFLLANELPKNNNPAQSGFTLTRQQIMGRLKLTPRQFAYLKKHGSIAKKQKLPQTYTCAEYEVISSLVDWGKSTSWGRNSVDSRVFYTADEAASLMGISRYQLRQIIRYKLLKSSTGCGRKSIIELNEWTKFKNKFTTTKSLAAQLGVPMSLIRLRIRERFPKAKSIGNQALDLLLVRAEHATALIRDGMQPLLHQHAESKRDYWAKRKKEIQLIDESGEYWTSIRQASTILGVAPSAIICWITNHQFTDTIVGKRGKHLIPTDQVINFWSKYMRTKDIKKLINLPTNHLTPILFLDGLKPVTGPLVDSGKTHLYLRSDVNEYIKKIQKLPASSYPNWLVATSAQAVLGTTEKRLNNIISIPYFSEAIKRVRNSTFISRNTLETFHKEYILIDEIARHLKTSQPATERILFSAGILPDSDPSIGGHGIAIFRRAGIFETLSSKIADSTDSSQTIPFSIKPQEKTQTERQQNKYIKDPNYILISDLTHELNISKLAFTKIFVNSGYVTPITHRGKEYLDKLTAENARSKLKDYYTCRQADEVFGQTGRTRNLIISNALTVAHPIPGHVSRVILVRKDQVHHLADTIRKQQKLI